MGGLVLGTLRACVVVYGILGWVTAASAQFTAESLSDDDITQAIALLIEETMEDWDPQTHWDPTTSLTGFVHWRYPTPRSRSSSATKIFPLPC